MNDLLDRFVDLVTTHNRVVVLVMLVLTAGMVVGMGQMETEEQADEADMFPETDASVAADHIEGSYGDDDNVAVAPVYVHEEDGNALSESALLESLAYQHAVLENESVAGALTGEPHSVATAVATVLAGEQDIALDEQMAALESASEEEVEAAVESVLTEESELLGLLPDSYEAGAASAEGQRLLFQFEGGENGQPPSGVQHALFAEASDRPAYFTLGEHATSEASATMNENTMQLVVPIALAIVLAVLALTYRDPVDVVVGLVGVLVSVLWMFGILGWLGIGAGMTMIIGPVLIAGLSIDFSFHVFNRYREQREADRREASDERTGSTTTREQREAQDTTAGDPDGIREPMRRGLRSVAVALGLVTVTAAIGFLSNVVNPVDMIRDLGVGITLGVASALVVFTTLVPALKISIDSLLERVGFDRRTAPLGHGRYLRPALRSSVVLAKRAAPVVIVLALVVGSAGAVAWTTLDERSFQQQTDSAAEWKQQLPGPLAWEDPEFNHNQQYVQDEYRAVAADESDRFQLLVEGDVTSDGTLRAVHEATEQPVFESQSPSSDLESPMTVIQSIAAEDEAFAATVDAADTTDDGVPDTDLETVYDHLYEVAPEQASQVVERDNGEYRSLRVVGPAESAGFQDDRTDDVRDAAAAIEDNANVTATAVSQAIVMDEGLAEITDGVLRVLVLALGAVSVGLVVISRRLHGSATVGAVTALPIVLVTGFVVGGMALLDVPLTLVTALLMSLVVGLGIDYNIHVTDRFVQELDRGHSGFDALERAVTGTGGALLGSALSSGGAFLALLVHPHPQIQSFGVLVVLALLAAFVVSVFVLPSMLALWWQHRRAGQPQQSPQHADPATTD